ncbi:MAG TPA: hypothetical protein VI298_16105 [Geobacteraceae bacterium]
MDLKSASRKFRPIPGKVLKRLADDGIITVPLSRSDQKIMAALCRIWTKEWYVAQMNKSFRLDKRAMMLAFPDFGKIERYILSSYLNLKPKMKISVEEMASRIEEFFKVEYPPHKIMRVRQIAYNLRRNDREETRKRTIIQLALLHEAQQRNDL